MKFASAAVSMGQFKGKDILGNTLICFLAKILWEDWYYCHYAKYEATATASQLSLAQKLETTSPSKVH